MRDGKALLRKVLLGKLLVSHEDPFFQHQGSRQQSKVAKIEGVNLYRTGRYGFAARNKGRKC